ncbi:MAG: pitrilysin family protein [bacterium]|nr:pitrilysin family protein [bacterium]
MKVFLGVVLVLGMSGVARAGHEGAVVAPGPVTSLGRLESLQQIPANPELRRAVPIQHWATKNGARVYFVAARELPMVDLRLVFDAGGARDGALGGLASTVSHMLDEGTLTRDTSAIANAFEMAGASYSASSHRDMAVVELRVLSDAAFRDPALEVFADVLAHPQFPEAAFARIRQDNEIGLQQKEQSPSALASLNFYKALYGAHPYAQPPTGTRQTLAKIRREDLQAFHQRFYVARNLTIAMVGALSREEAEAVAERVSRELPAGAPAETLPAVVPLAKARQLHQEFPSQQTHIMLGVPGIRYGDPDNYALTVGNEILGGGAFTSQLMTEIRQKRGLTYGVYSGFSPMRVEGPFTITLSTRSDQTAEALKITRQVLSDFVRRGPDADAVREAKANIVRGFPLSTSSNASIVGYLGAIGFYQLPLDYLDQYVARIQAVTPEEVRSAMQRHINPDRMVVVTVGKGKP